MSTQTASAPTAASPALAYIEHLRQLAKADQAVKPSAEVVRTVLAKAGMAQAVVRVLSGGSVTYVHLAPGTDRNAVIALLSPLWVEHVTYGTVPRVRSGVDMVTIQRTGWENTRPASAEVPVPQVVASGMTEQQLFDVADVIDEVMASRPAGIFWTISDLASALTMRRGEVPATAAVLTWMVDSGFVARLQPRSSHRVLFLRQHVAA